MSKEQLMTMDEIWEVLGSLPFTSPVEELEQMLSEMSAECRALNLPREEASRRIRQKLTPWAQELRDQYLTPKKK